MTRMDHAPSVPAEWPGLSATIAAQHVPRPSASVRLPVLDGLRLLAALMVVGFHLVHNSSSVWGAPPAAVFGPLDTVARYGWLGVQLFFLISGFVICMSSWGRGLGDFFVSRAVRLYPAYWAAVLLTTAVLTLWPVILHRLPLPEILANLTMLNGLLGLRFVDNSYWTLTVELVFYLLFAVVVARGVNHRRVVAFCGLWTVASVLALSTHNPWLNLVLAAEHAPYFVAGMALFLVHRFGPNLLLWSIVGISWLLAVAGAAGRAYARGVSYPAVIVIISAFFLVMSAVSLGLLSRIRARWLVTAGALTYPLYLLHQMIGLTAIAGLHSYVPAYALLTGLVVALLLAAWLVHRWVERPVSRWMKRHLSGSMRRLRTAPAPSASR
ncbi:acyltransferase family protein [Catellatospora tritici]|uniref:acyltransferase family protein n=1 Tax=Catellatospora tritici TaxID=2851566 RepID=UPI001C2CF36C|nr:acyltransferase [Catellatospora tritici]MBV1850446.1 acyltransferase [Catellatospora tritici]